MNIECEFDETDLCKVSAWLRAQTRHGMPALPQTCSYIHEKSSLLSERPGPNLSPILSTAPSRVSDKGRRTPEVPGITTMHILSIAPLLLTANAWPQGNANLKVPVFQLNNESFHPFRCSHLHDIQPIPWPIYCNRKAHNAVKKCLVS